VTLWSRRGNLFTNQFPQIARACARLPPGTLVDGEIVALDESGRISFNLLQHHRSKARALLFYVFDVLIYRGRSLLQEPLERRREILSEIFKRKKAAPIALSESLNAIWSGSQRSLGSRASSPSARIPSTNQASELAHGSSTRSTGGRSLSSAATLQEIHLMR
jgi:ATP-dependent DNA ligase